MSTGSNSTREEQLRSHVAQLKEELEREKAEKRQVHHDKVREIKAAREKEQTNAREQLENLKAKLQKEKTQELQEQRDQLVSDFHQQIKTTEKQYEDQLHDLELAHKTEKQELTEKLRAEISQELEEVLGSKYETGRRKMEYEMFEFQQQVSALEAKNANLMDADRNTVTVLKDADKQHRNVIEKLNKQHRLALKKQMEELEAMNRKMQSKDKELAKLTERLSRTEADRDKLQDEVKRLKQAESWTRRSATPPSLSPSSSMNDLVSKRERDMIMKNSELSFRVSTLEDGIAQLRQEKSKLQTKLKESRQQLAPLEEYKLKLGHRINDLNSSLRSREKKIEYLSKEVLELKSGKQQLEEETARQRKSLQQQMSISSTHRAEKDMLKSKNTKLHQANTSLSDQLEKLMSENTDLQERLSMSPPPVSPVPLPLSPSSPPDDDSPLSSSANSSVLMEQLDQLQFDKEESLAKYEESQEKYEEIKGEYVDLRDKYKKVRSKYEDLQEKYRGLHANCKLLGEQLRILEKEHRDLEHEVVLLRRIGRTSSSHDVKRFETMLDLLQKQLEEKEKKICELEDFIVEQDEVASKTEKALKQELQSNMTERSEEGITVDMQQLNKQVNDLQTELETAREILKSKEEEIELQQRLSAISEQTTTPRKATDGDKMTDSDIADSPLTAVQLEHCVRQYKTQIVQLDEKNMGLQRDLADAIAQVSQLQELAVELEGRLEEDQTAHEEAVTGRDEEIDSLNQRLTQLETKLFKLNRGVPFDPSRKDFTPLADQVYEAIAKVRHAATADPDMLNPAVISLEGAVNELIHTLIPTYLTPTLPSSSPLTSPGANLQPTELPADVTSTPSPPASPAPPPPVSSPPASPVSPPPVSPSSILKISSDFTDLPLTYHRVVADGPRTQDSWSQTSPPHSSRNQPSQTVSDGRMVVQTTSAGRPRTMECSTQTPLAKKVRAIEQSTQTPPSRRIVTVERSSQTAGSRTPRRVESSSQTTSGGRRLGVDNSTQTPRGWRQATPGVMQTVMPSSWTPGTCTVEQILQNGHSPAQRQPHGRDTSHTHDMCDGPLSSSWPNNSRSKPVSEDDDVGERRMNGVGDELPRVFVAVMDYDPNSLCTTGRPDLELTVHTGDIVCVEGEMDESGYYQASFGGLTGLLPANFIQETEVVNPTTRERLFNQSLSHNWSTSSSPVSSKGQQRSPLTHNQLPREGSTFSPQAPLSFHVEKVLGHNGLLVAWQPPPMDAMCRSNGCLVTGYQLYVNGQTKTLVSGASQSRTLLSGLSLTKSLRLGISTSSIEGKSSQVVEIVYRGRPISISRTSPEPDTYRTFVGLYDYDPAKCSPSDNPEFELSFKEGDIILVHGQEKDGFLVGELNGKHGWVPASFVTQVSGQRDQAKSQVLSPSDALGGAHLTTSRRMVAVYDYDPLHISPNPNPDAELAFHAGDVITVYGYMQSDGFYSGELNGRCGLVPSNFLREIQESYSDTWKNFKVQAKH